MTETKNKIYKEIRKEGRKGEREEGRKEDRKGFVGSKSNFFSPYKPYFE